MSLTTLRGVLLLGALSLAGASCSGSGGTTIKTTGNGNGNGNSSGGIVLGGPSPVSLVSTCDNICNNVVAQCTASDSLYQTCTDACGDLSVIQQSCLDPFASYLTCLAGANSVQCGGGGQYVLITPPECEADREATLNCNAEPGIFAACIALPGNTSCGGEGGAVFCVGAPAGCTSPESNPLGIGVYCCPS
jgi:hypothetical protein